MEEDFKNAACPLGLTIEQLAERLQWPDLPDLYRGGEPKNLLRLQGIEDSGEIYVLKFGPVYGEIYEDGGCGMSYSEAPGLDSEQAGKDLLGFSVGLARETDNKVLMSLTYLTMFGRFNSKGPDEGSKTTSINGIDINYSPIFMEDFRTVLLSLAANASAAAKIWGDKAILGNVARIQPPAP